VTAALYETALAWSVLQMNQFLGAGEVPLPQGSGTAMICPYEAFPTRDAWVMIAAASDALFAKACEALGVPGMPRDPRFRDNPSRVAHRNDVFESVSAVTRNFASVEVLERLQRAGVPCAPILTLDKVAAEPQTVASGMLVPAKHPRLPDYRAVGLPIRWDGERPPVARVPPLLGEHTAEVLGELGYDTAAIQELVSRHVVQL
jgi:formyl-CoA transferase/CoA:oxalate CoA-transferase